MFQPLRPGDRQQKPVPGLRVNMADSMAPYSAWLFNEGAGNQLNEAVFGVPAAVWYNVFPTWIEANDLFVGPALRFVAGLSSFVDFSFNGPGGSVQQPVGIGTPRYSVTANQPFSFAVRARTTNAGVTGLHVYREFPSGTTLG